MKKETFVLALFLLCAALPLAQAAFTEKLTVQVYDQLFRPVEGAEIYADYQLNSVSGYTRTAPKSTNVSGQVEIVITNYEEIESSTKYSYTLFVKYGNTVNSTALTAEANRTSNSRVVTLRVPAYFLFVYVKNQKGSPLNALVSIDQKKRQTNQVGLALFQVPRGNFTVRAESANSIGSAVVRNLESDQTLSIEVGIYSLVVFVADDNRNPLQATVEVEGFSEETDGQGIASFANLSMEAPSVIVKHGDNFRRFTPNLRASPKLEAVFDLHKPIIKELHATVSDSGVGTISLFVEDPGTLATGVESVSVTYEANGVESSVPAYSIGYNSFEAKIASQLPNTLVKYLVRVTDRESNTVSEAGTYIVSPDVPVSPTNTTNGLPKLPPWQPGNLPTEAIILGVIVAAIIIFAAVYYMVKMRRVAPPS
ncbi:MAG: hypothetical protein UW92_C0001G0028 [Candidatus Jorgensenbacteria bacterium GW2011_GWA2_45_13]|uniref:Uncharacterized protein n=1 Tax=Candidatus Jorgensenbacteria bacterium GW2011_GWA2_45_13 TaxID=1618662 RepID=A0A0G1NH71_9BACT|nr:MAG: hypothetical protein UW92_C0001G0028 [Candidatus Jorgensenbacteria bacterium GW2011_GWA2_45_13]HIH18983.1 hypothetical protein [Candidatus Micrarchaeota archaeon]HIH30260.1 hypothetical protein [Candidatus Micrarchaeota archaeon]